MLSDAGVSFLGEHMSEGTLFELNNGKAHAVQNRSPTPRVHLIMDMYPECGREGEPAKEWAWHDGITA